MQEINKAPIVVENVLIEAVDTPIVVQTAPEILDIMDIPGDAHAKLLALAKMV